MSALHAAGLWSALLILLLVALSIRVMLGRRRLRIAFGDGKAGELATRSRAFGNAAEYTPLMIGALILLAQMGAGAVEIHALGGAFLAGRVLHAPGMAMKPPNLPRALGMILTWIPLIAAAGLILFAIWVSD
ncbi:MAPEG family protein [Brevundimonas sp.]|jgi:uncharacterized protein|uniref:MAPEG family protein n=1 Tax=Brevundimonas sp. TaxID=1871086 RepID=UPI002633A054|nr:MAPEG family protein [Brevundimonas sp.]